MNGEIQELTQLERSVLVRYARGMDIEEIQKEDGVTRAEVNRRIRRIREKLGLVGKNWAHVISYCYYHGRIRLGDVFDSPTQGRAAGYDLTRRNNVGN